MYEAPPPGDLSGDHLTLDEYLDDYYARFWRTDRRGCWKLERQQTFRELDNASWEAADRGNWEEAVALLEKGREGDRRYQEKVRAHGFEFHRVRIVDKPYSAYLIWELNSLLIRHRHGERIRVLPREALGELEAGQPLPEVVVLGSEVAYRVIYDATGLAVGAVRSTRSGTVRGWAAFIRRLYERGENLPDFFAREIADLRPARSG